MGRKARITGDSEGFYLQDLGSKFIVGRVIIDEKDKHYAVYSPEDMDKGFELIGICDGGNPGLVEARRKARGYLEEIARKGGFKIILEG